MKTLRVLLFIVLLSLVLVVIMRYPDLAGIRKVIVKPPDSDETDLNDIIAATCSSIGVTESNYSVQNKSDHILIKVGINHNEMDLLLANSIITGKVMAGGGQLANASESANGSYQLLEFKSPKNPKPYLVRLYYGNYERQGKEIYLIIDDFGSYKTPLLDDFCNLDAEVSFAIIPNEHYYQEVMLKADSTHHDILIHIPMEPIDIKNNDPGEKAILVEYSPARIKEYTREYIEKIPLAVGANNHMGSLATSMEKVMTPVLQVLKENGLFFIDSFTTANSIVAKVAAREMVMSSRRDLFLDDYDLKPSTLEKKLVNLDEIAARKDQIIVIGHCHSKEKYDFVNEFIRRAKKAGYRFNRISKLFSSGSEV
ncbi:MAG: divergent polysaccharide deacetylase family protein [Candidatus Cloacimonetes bacterium]|nr:divergent polysaccharide deacetylase family protein [Candidatus Cloacimonadota bacterium]